MHVESTNPVNSSSESGGYQGSRSRNNLTISDVPRNLVGKTNGNIEALAGTQNTFFHVYAYNTDNDRLNYYLAANNRRTIRDKMKIKCKIKASRYAPHRRTPRVDVRIAKHTIRSVRRCDTVHRTMKPSVVQDACKSQMFTHHQIAGRPHGSLISEAERNERGDIEITK